MAGEVFALSGRGPDPLAFAGLLEQQQAEHQGEQCHRFDNTDDNEVVCRALSGLAQCIGGGGGNLALEEGGIRYS